MKTLYKALLVIFFCLFSFITFANILQIFHSGEKTVIKIEEIDKISHSTDGLKMVISMKNGYDYSFNVEEVEDVCIGSSEIADMHNGLIAGRNFIKSHKLFSSIPEEIKEFVKDNPDIIEGDCSESSVYLTLNNGAVYSYNYVDVHGSNFDFTDNPNTTSGRTSLIQYLRSNNLIGQKSNEEILTNKTVLIINAMADDWNSEEKGKQIRYGTHLEEIANKFKKAGFVVTFRNGEEVKPTTYTEEMPEYGLTFILSHGDYYANKKIHSLQTGIPNASIMHPIKGIEAIGGEILSQTFGVGNLGFMEVPGTSNMFVTITEKGLKNDMQNFIDPASQVFNLACNSLTGNDSMAKLMIEKGLGAYWGFEGNVGLKDLDNSGAIGGLDLMGKYADLLLEGLTTNEISSELCHSYGYEWIDGDIRKKGVMKLKLVGKDNLIVTNSNYMELYVNIPKGGGYKLLDIFNSDFIITDIECIEKEITWRTTDWGTDDKNVFIFFPLESSGGIYHLKINYTGELVSFNPGSGSGILDGENYEDGILCGGVLPSSIQTIDLGYDDISIQEISTSKIGDEILTVPKTIESIEGHSNILRSLDLSECSTLSSIEDGAFSGCENLQSLNFTGCSNLTSIGRDAFGWCSNLQSLNFTGCSSLSSIGDDAFYGCESLNSLKFTGCSSLSYIGKEAFCYHNLSKLDLSPLISLRELVNEPFKQSYDSYSLKELILPESIAKIDMGLRQDNVDKLEKLICYAVEVPQTKNSFYNVPKIYVPDQSIIEYQNEWGDLGPVSGGRYIYYDTFYYYLSYYKLEPNPDRKGWYFLIDPGNGRKEEIPESALEKRYDYINIFPISSL